jgi:hypothetical protein
LGVNCTSDGFCQVSPEVTANRLNAVWGSGPKDVWAVGDGGTIVHYDGTVWQRVASGTDAHLLGVSGTSERDVWFVGEDGTAIHYDGFALDAARGPSPAAHLIAAHAIAPNDVWMATGNQHFPVDGQRFGAVFHWDGSSWRDLRPEPGGTFHRALWATASNDVWLTGDGTYHYDGTAWRHVFGLGGSDIWGISSTSAWIPDETSSDVIWHIGGANTVRSRDGDEHRKLLGIWGSSERDLWSVGSQGYILHYDGSGWTAVESGTTRTLTAVWGSSARDVWAVGELGTILQYDGSSWSTAVPDRIPERSPTFNAIWAASDEEQWIATSAGIFAYDGRTQTRRWGPDAMAQAPDYRSVWGTTRDNVVAVGSSGAIAEFDGKQWTREASSPTTQLLSAVWGHGEKMLAVGGRIGVIRIGTGDWRIEPVTGGAGGALSAIWGSSANDIWVTSFISGVVGHYVGGRWEEQSTPAFAASLWGSARDDIWGVGSQSVFHYDGTSWTGEGLPAKGLQAITGCAGMRLWAVGRAGVILQYDGQSWRELDSGTTNDLKGVRCSGRDVWVVGEGGIILKKGDQP